MNRWCLLLCVKYVFRDVFQVCFIPINSITVACNSKMLNTLLVYFTLVACLFISLNIKQKFNARPKLNFGTFFSISNDSIHDFGPWFRNYLIFSKCFENALKSCLEILSCELKGLTWFRLSYVKIILIINPTDFQKDVKKSGAMNTNDRMNAKSRGWIVDSVIVFEIHEIQSNNRLKLQG